MTPHSGDSPSRGLIAGMWVVGYLVTVLGPALLLWNLLDDFGATLRRSRETRQEEKAVEMLARLDQAVDPAKLLSDGLTIFHRRIERSWRADRSPTSQVIGFDRELGRRICRSSIRWWFAADGRLIKLPDLPVLGQRSIENLHQALVGMTPQDGPKQVILQNTIRSMFGSLITLEIMQQALQRPIPVLYQGRPHLFSCRRFRPIQANPASPRGNTIVASLLVLIPLDRGRPGWNLDRGIRRLSGLDPSSDPQFGGVWLSNQLGTSTSRLDPGLIDALWNNLRRTGSGITFQGHVYRARLCPRDPNLLLVAGVGALSDSSRRLEDLVALGQILLPVFASLLAVLFWCQASGRLWQGMSLETTFRLGTALLALMPLGALLIGGMNHLHDLRQTETDEAGRRLESLLDRFEMTLAEERSRMEAGIRRFQRSMASRAGNDPPRLSTFFRQEKDRHGLKTLVFARPLQEPIRLGVDLSSDQERMRLAVLYKLLEKHRFQIPGQRNPLDTSPELSLFLEKYGEQDMEVDFNRFRLVQFGERSFSLYQGFTLSPAGEKVTFIWMIYEFLKFRSQLLERAFQAFSIHQGKPSGALAARITDLEAAAQWQVKTRFGSHHPKLRTLIDLVQVTGEPLRSSFQIHHREYLALARPIKDLQAVAVIARPLSQFRGPMAETARMLGLISFLGGIAALLTAVLLPRHLLLPLLSIGTALRGVERGDYHVEVRVPNRDELGDLAWGLATMTSGLREKERMGRFLRRDLIEQSQTPGTGSRETIREDVVVSFSGLRGFADFESALPPEEAVVLMSRFLELCVTSVRAHGGEIDKFIGDTAMAVFRAKEPAEGREDGSTRLSPAAQATAAARHLSRQVDVWMERRREAGLPTLAHGIGIAAGEAIIGQVGSLRKRLDFTAIGDIVNIAARLEKLAGRPGTPIILATSQVCDRLPNSIRRLPTAIDAVRGRVGAIEVFGLDAEDRP